MKLQSIVSGVQHIGIPTDDIEKTIAFYTGLGFEVVLRTGNRVANEQVGFLRLKNLTIETYENYQGTNKTGAIDHVALDVSDIEAAFQMIKESGYALLDEEIQFLPFWSNGVKFFTVKGPNEEKIEFCQIL